ncbi:MAG TPA: HD domain-containing phosphohydrolase [Phycisphaerae bacterium]|nr:HD domain-containing phosphohydrolase [Phycisphaerae bacterium]HRW51752.1 HD domain-containing phosphohydrolase [Phycisphaerae bacterium]
MEGLTLTTAEALLEALHCGALVINRDGLILLANEEAADLMKWPIGDLNGRMVPSLYAEGPERDYLNRMIANFEVPRQIEYHVPTRDGGKVPVIISSNLLGRTPPLSHYKLVTLTDISRQKSMQKRLADDYQTISHLSDKVLDQALDLKHYSERLEGMVRERTLELHEANMESIYMLALACESRDQDTGLHIRRIKCFTEELSRELGLSEREIEIYGYSAILHDVGKVMIPDHVLKKPGKLTPAERRVMEMHTAEGERILSDSPFFSIARTIARSHHENWDGSGYPDNVRHEDIPLPARIVRIVDVYDALISRRAYKPAWPKEEALRIILDGGENLFDPIVLRAFETIMGRGGFIAESETPSRLTCATTHA